MSAGALLFEVLSTAVEADFWEAVHRLKLEQWRLSSDKQRLRLGYDAVSGKRAARAAVLAPKDAFEMISTSANVGMIADVVTYNSIEEFKAADKRALLAAAGDELWQVVMSSRGREAPQQLNNALLLLFPDLKSHEYTYWFAFPAFSSPNPIQLFEPCAAVTSQFDRAALLEIHTRFGIFLQQCGDDIPPFFVLAMKDGQHAEVHSLNDAYGMDPTTLTFCGFDTTAQPNTLGWVFRNLLTHLRVHWGLDRVRILAIRGLTVNKLLSAIEPQGAEVCYDDDQSLLFHVDLASMGLQKDEESMPRVVGWELNARGKPGAKQANMSAMMSPLHLAESSADLNLKLMKWRLVPDLDTDILATTKCLLIGAGTLGCAVARTLLGWGIRHITFVDNGRVSYSNPTRQSLYEFQDCEQGKLKAHAAAEALKRIYPGVNARGEVMSIPMPGHQVSSTETAAVRETIDRLNELVTEHDVVYVLTDTRESRWLPTVLCSLHDKMLINVALGFDTYLVIRHGSSNSDTKLGCYFCNDVASPGDSTRDRTIDQQCTVTRPGLAPIASALGVELMVALLHHPLKHHAPAGASEDSCMATVIPHQIRGFMTSFHSTQLTGLAFPNCVACSAPVVEEFADEGPEVVFRACASPAYLEELSGIAALTKDLNDAEFDFEFSDSGDDTELKA